MNERLQTLWTWCRNKYGRLVTAAGFLLSGIETFDITPIRDPLESVIGHVGVSIATIACFALSFVRHQQVAARVTKLKEAVAPITVPPKDVPEK
jgi:hypothetical protein